jgi:hypothetical protein
LLAKPFASLNQRLQTGWQGASILNAHFQVARAFGCAESEQRHLSSHIPGATPSKHDFIFRGAAAAKCK